MHKKINSYFLIFIILFSMFPVSADAPIKYYEIDSDIELRGAIFVNVDSTEFYASLNNGIIQIDSNNHYNNVLIKFKGTALNSRLKKYNGFNVGYTHITDNGIITNELKPLEIDYQGFAYLTCDFSTVIINGMTGTTTTTLTGLSGNQSISVPNGSSYDLNITNNQLGVWTINGTDFSKRVLWTLNITSENLTNFQIKKIIPYDFDMQIDMDDKQITYYENDTLISFWDEVVINSTNATSYIKVPKTSTTEQQQYWLYYKNSSVNSASNGDDTFIQWHGASSVTFLDALIVNPTNIVYESKARTQSDTHNFRIGLSNTETTENDDCLKIISYHSTNKRYMSSRKNNVATNVDEIPKFTTNTYYKLKIINDGTNVSGFVNENQISANITTNIPTDNMGLSMWLSNGAGDQLWSFIRKYTTIEPTWAANGEEQTASGTVNITATITGDFDEQSYNTSQSREFILTPTGLTNNIIINTTSIDYNVTVITYWTENTTLQSETAIDGYAKQYINYTPLFNITSTDLNTTFTFNFSAQDYIGTATSTLDGVLKTTTRDGQDINASVGSLIEATPYWWNVTVLYNNIFTLSNQSDTTAYLGISKQFNDSNYNDPDNNPILSRLWNFGDSTNINISDPTHTYTSLGVFNTNYTVTEDAPTNSQTITKEFNVTVKIQPPQNVTTISHQTNVSINWDDYAYADKYSVYELEDGFPYVDIDPVIDGVKDAIYDYAHEFLIFSPNPITHGDYDTIYPIRTALGAYLLIESIDNDDKLGDDDTIYYFDLDNDGLTVNDPAWKITDNIIKKYLWDGNSWQVTGGTNAVGDSTGGGTHYPIHELFIPITELGANWTNGSTVKVLVKREDSALSPDVIAWYPYGNINNTDTNLWQEMVLNDPESYNLLTNVTLSNYTALNLTPFTIYHGAVSSWNDTTESNYTLFDVITEDIRYFNVSGYILDDLGNTLSGAIVYSCNGFVHEITQSDIYGYWIGYNFREGNYTICGNKSGYIDNSTDIYVSSNMSNVNVTLTAYIITDWEIYQKLLLLESQNDEILLNMSINNTIVNDKIDTILIFILLNMAVIVGIIMGKRGKNNDK